MINRLNKPKAKLAPTKAGASVRAQKIAAPLEAKMYDPLEILLRETYTRRVCQRQVGQKPVG